MTERAEYEQDLAGRSLERRLTFMTWFVAVAGVALCAIATLLL